MSRRSSRRGADLRALQGPPRRPAAGGDRDGGHPRRHAGPLLDLPRQHRRHRDHPPVKDDLTDWNLHRLVWVADRGFASAANRAYLTRGGGHYIHAEKLRHTNAEAAAALARPGRYHTVAGNLRVKEVRVAPAATATATRARTVRDLPQPRSRRNATPPCATA